MKSTPLKKCLMHFAHTDAIQNRNRMDGDGLPDARLTTINIQVYRSQKVRTAGCCSNASQAARQKTLWLRLGWQCET